MEQNQNNTPQEGAQETTAVQGNLDLAALTAGVYNPNPPTNAPVIQTGLQTVASMTGVAEPNLNPHVGNGTLMETHDPSVKHGTVAFTPGATLLPADDEDESHGSGMVIVNEKEVIPPAPGELDVERLGEIGNYMKNMEEDVKEAAKTYTNLVDDAPPATEEAAKEETPEEAEKSDEERESEFNEAYGRAVVVIDKGNMGVVQFTAEEREKLELARTIRLEEVEQVELGQLQVVKRKNKNVDRLIRQRQSFFATPIVLPTSGYTANILGLSSHELLTLVNSTQNPQIDMQARWSIIHSKLESTSVGDMNYDKFMRSTAVADFNILVFGLLCATYPEDDSITMTCDNPKCKHSNPETPYMHTYSTRSLLRAESMTDELKEQIVRIVDNSTEELKAHQVHEMSPVNSAVRYRLPKSGIVFETADQTAHDFVTNSLPAMEELEERYQNAAILATLVRTAYVPIGDGKYEDFDDKTDIMKLIYNLQDVDTRVLQHLSQLQGKLSFEFGFMDVKCPACGKYHEVIPVDNIEDMVFYRYQQNMQAGVE